MRTRRLGACVFALLLAASAASCQFTEPDTPVETPPLLFRSATPASGVVDQYDPNGRTLVVRFNRAFEPHELRTLRMVPAPVSTGRLSFDTPKQLVWYDVVFDPTVSAYDWLLDGHTLREPVLITLYTSTSDRDLGTISGRLRSGSGRNADDAVVYVLERTLAPEPVPDGVLTFLGRRVLRIVRPDPAEFGENDFSIGNLDTLRTRRFFVAAIDDTDGDGRYDPRFDWWGYYRDAIDSGVARPVLPYLIMDEEERRALGLPLPTSTNFELVPPGSLQPTF